MKNARKGPDGRWHAYKKVGEHQRFKRFELDQTAKQVQAWIDETAVALRKLPKTPSRHGSLKADIQAYLRREEIKALISFKSRQSEMWAWVERYGSVPRSSLTRQSIMDARETWQADGYAAKTINHRIWALRHLYSLFDGSKAPTPCDDIPKLKEADPDPKFVPVAVINRILPKITNPQTRAIFMVLVATGQRPAQLRRTRRIDVNLRLRIWRVRPAKGGNPIPLPLTDDMVAAWNAFIAADCFDEDGLCRHFDGSDYARRVYAAGWKKSQYGRPYNAKHTIGITLGESDAEWEDIKDWFGHTDVKTTRIYTGLIPRRLQGTSRLLNGRLGWAPDSGLIAASGAQRPNQSDSGRKAHKRKQAGFGEDLKKKA